MNLTQRNVALTLQGLLVVGLLIVFLISLFSGTPAPALIAVGASVLITGGILAAYYYHVPYALHVSVWAGVLMTPLSMPESYIVNGFAALLIPAGMALIFTGPWTIAGSGVATMLIAIWRGSGGVLATPQGAILYLICVTALVLARLLLDAERRRAEQSAARAEEARSALEQQARLLSRQAEELVDQNDQQRRLLDLVATLESPVVRLAEGVLLVPLLGQLDERRIGALMSRVLEEAHRRRARTVILDITGVPVVDSQVAQGLLGTARALRLLGCSVTLSGVNADVAMAITALGLELGDLHTVADAEAALQPLVGAQR